MEERIIEFAGVLREHGIRVSTAETIDAVRLTQLTGVGDRSRFRTALQASMVKRPGDVELYRRLFNTFFSGIGDIVRDAGEAAGRSFDNDEMREILQQLKELLDGEGSEGISGIGQALILQDSGEFERLLRELLESGNMPKAQGNYVPPNLTKQMLEMLGAGRISEELDRLLEQAEERGATESEIERLREYFSERMKALREAMKGMLKIQRDQVQEKEQVEKERDRLLEKSFYYLSPREIQEMREAVSSLARKLKNLLAIRYKRTKRGRLDVRTTLRQSMEYGGVPFKVRYDDRRRERPQIVILCDVSDSVKNVSRFMLQFVHSLQDMYSRVRSYVFVADIAEVTDAFRENDIQSAIQSAINGDMLNVYAHSNFGQAFAQFHAGHLDVIDSRTTVIILGDGRNNYNAPNDWVLRDIAERARQVIWLNPENRPTWGYGDSEMTLYGQHCDVVEECRNLRQLYKVVDMLLTA